MPYTIETIGDKAFSNDEALTEIYTPVRVTSIKDTAFSYPEKMTIYGIEGSYAQELANEKEIAFQIADTVPTEIAINTTEASVSKNKTMQLFSAITPAEYMGDAEWNSSDETIATIDKNGIITAINEGEVTITIKTTHGTAETTCAITVTKPPLALGDVDGNGGINTADALAVLKYVANLIDLDDNAKKLADVNGDNKVNTSDALDILKKIANLIDKFEAEKDA